VRPYRARAAASASSNRPWIAWRSSAVRAATSPRRTLAPGARSGGGIGSPTITTTLLSRGSLRPRPRIRSLPPIPIGTIGTPIRAATKATPWCRSSTTGPDRRVPSGNMPSGSPPAGSAALDREAAQRGEERGRPAVLPQLGLAHEPDPPPRDAGQERRVEERP